MDQPLLAIQLRDPDRRFSGGYDVIDVRSLSHKTTLSIQRLPLVCPLCFGPAAAVVRDREPTGERRFALQHLSDDHGCMKETESSNWIPSLANTPNTFFEIASNLRAEHDLNDREISLYRERLARGTTTLLRHASSVSALVHCIKHHGTSLSSRPFHLLGSSVTCWHDLIVDALPSTEDASPHGQDRKIFRGKLEGEHLDEDGNILFFRERTGDRRTLECKIPYPSEHERFKSLLPKSFSYEGGIEHDIFVLGSMRLDSRSNAFTSVLSERYICLSPRVF